MIWLALGVARLTRTEELTRPGLVSHAGSDMLESHMLSVFLLPPQGALEEWIAGKGRVSDRTAGHLARAAEALMRDKAALKSQVGGGRRAEYNFHRWTAQLGFFMD